MIKLATTALTLVLHIAVPGLSKERLDSVVKDMVIVVDEEFDGKGLKSNIQKQDALAMLAAAATNESGLWESVENCKIVGDAGKSIGLTQLMSGPSWEGHSRKEICGNRKLQFKLALHVFDRCWEKSPHADAAFRCYTSGDHKKYSNAARNEHALYKRLVLSMQTLHVGDQNLKNEPTSKLSNPDLSAKK